jgi:predicted nucleic acid-binding protein
MATAGARGVGVTGLLDTNVALYLLGGRLASPLPPGDYGVSVITQMELLSWPSLTKEETKRVNAFLSTLTLCDLTPAIRVRAVCLRREERLKLPDTIVCATALEHGVELWTNDARLANVTVLVCRSVSLTA